ncbi:DEAD/DEAH box helicase family protein, partial [Candidatus Bipolaricaulota bacterium]|nr:DEAD/DEAH box helicase family protein [Candidatus Bipolaricaulota bacterium]
MIRLGRITPEAVAEFINFDRDHPSWCYRSGEQSMFAKQAEGVAHIWNLLSEKQIALLADEVGMGKTLQALSISALYWRVKPDARILIIAPREVVAVNWQNEFLTFLANHYRRADDVVKTTIGGQPIHQLVRCRNLPELIAKSAEGCHHFFVAKTTSFSYVNNEFQDRDGRIKRDEIRRVFGNSTIGDIPKDDQNRARFLGGKLRERLVSTLSGEQSTSAPAFDLLIVDEAHYYRNKNDGSLRVNAAAGFFGGEESGRIADRVLLLTATPNHTSVENIEAIVSYFVDAASLIGATAPADPQDPRDRAERLLRAIGLRRNRTLAGRSKYQYRDENAVAADFAGSPAGELFFALYQKRLVQALKQQEKRGKGNKRLFFGYLEGFESLTPSEEVSDAEYDDEKRESLDFARNWDSEILKELSKSYQDCYGRRPSHPKYDRMIETVLSASERYWEGRIEKNLIFVRRIPSLKEICRRIIDSYDKLFWDRILSAWQTHQPQIDSTPFKDRIPARREYYRAYTVGARGFEEDDSDQVEESPEGPEEEPESDIPQSAVLDLFTVKKKGRGESVAYTHATSFRVRFVRDESLFALFFQPAVDYRAAPYQGIAGYKSTDSRGSKARIYYDTSCGMARFDHPANRYRERDKVVLKDLLYGEKISSGEERILDTPARTLWSIMWEQLGEKDDRVLTEIDAMTAFDREALALYLRKGILYASAALIELYCWFIRAQSQTRG